MNYKVLYVVTLMLFASSFNASAQLIYRIAGDTTYGDPVCGSAATATHLSGPFGIAVDDNNNVYFSEYSISRILKISSDGIMTCVAGTDTMGSSGIGGPATAATINTPLGIAIDPSGNVYFCDSRNNCVKKIDHSGMLSVFAGIDTPGWLPGTPTGDGGPATATLLSPVGIVFDKEGNAFITDMINYRIRKVNTSGIITTFAGGDTVFRDNVPATTTSLSPSALAIDEAGNLYVSDNSTLIRKINSAGIITTIGGQGAYNVTDIGDGGPATATYFSDVNGIALDADGNVFFSDVNKVRIRKIDTRGLVYTIAGSGGYGYNGDGGYAESAPLIFPGGVAFDKKGNLLFSDANIVRMVKYDVFTGVSSLENKEYGISLFPNPSGGTFSLLISSGRQEEVKVAIMSIAGQRVKEISATTNVAADIKLDVPAGLYFVIATSATERWMQQLIIK